jgi:hypothetical protein
MEMITVSVNHAIHSGGGTLVVVAVFVALAMVTFTTALVMLATVEFEDMACLSGLWISRAGIAWGKQPKKQMKWIL